MSATMTPARCGKKAEPVTQPASDDDYQDWREELGL